MFISSLSRTALSEKKPTVKPKSPEKSKPEEKDPEKSPTKKQEGSSSIGLFYSVRTIKSRYGFGFACLNNIMIGLGCVCF